jgi:phospholipid/cholesterol/gamma-HCH transport system substrate-binding protein
VTRAQPRLIGLLVLGAIGLIVAGIASMSARRLFAEYRTFVVFFPYAVGGLREGSPVTFRQVQVGHVRDVDLVFSGDDLRNSWIMAVIDIRRGALRDPTGKAAQQSDAELAQVMINAGLRASVRSSSLIAGQRSVDLDFQAGQKARLSGLVSPYPEIPTAPTGMEVINERVEETLRKISEVPVDQVILQLNTTLATLQRVLEQSDAPRTTRQLRTSLDAMTRTLASAEKAIAQVDGMTVQARTTLGSMDQTMKGIQKTLERLERTLATVDRSVEGTGELGVEATKAIDEMNELLKALRSLVENLQQRPESLLRGRPAPRPSP